MKWIRKIRRTSKRPSSATPRRYRGAVLFGAGALALVLATTGIVAALAGRSTPAVHAKEAPAAGVLSTMNGEAPATRQSNGAPGSSSTGTPTGVSSTAPQPVLDDGTYPAYIRGVDIHGAAITVDVIQVFEDQAAADAAIEDGASPSDARYLYVYVRNESSRLRTLSVAPDVRIDFLGTCEAPPNRNAALTELARATMPFSRTYYYTITVAEDAIHHIEQHLAVPAC